MYPLVNSVILSQSSTVPAYLISFKPTHTANTLDHSSVKDFGNVTYLSLAQSKKAWKLIFLTPSGITMLPNFLQPAKAKYSMVLTVRGILAMVSKAIQLRKNEAGISLIPLGHFTTAFKLWQL